MVNLWLLGIRNKFQLEKSLVKNLSQIYNMNTIIFIYKGESNMKKRNTKTMLTSVVLVLTLSVMALLTGCGGPSTLEEYINDNNEAKQELEKLNQSSQKGMDVSTTVKENTIIYTFKYDKTFTDKEKDAMAEYFEKYLDTAASTFQSIAKEMEEKSEIEGVKVRITYKNGDDSEIYNREFDAGK